MYLLNRVTQEFVLKVPVVIAYIFCSAFIFPIFAQISPGDLTRAHSNLEGISNCTKCHVLGEKVEDSKCLDCHTEIKSLIEENKGYHSSDEVKNKNCVKCHSEHNGRGFRIINFDEKDFDHNKTGYILSGKHSEIKCKDCHRPKFITVLGTIGKKVENTFLGLSEKCYTCHEDYHQNTLDKNCGLCHNTEKFIPASKFSHSLAAFVLTGAHEKVDCIKCHLKEKRNNKDFQIFKGISFANCSPCHQDVHKGRFGEDCKSCHSTSSFRDINKKEFDHNKTNFALKGMHSSVDCNGCHKNGLKAKLKFQNCYDCHSDFHKGDFVKNKIMKDCSECHNVYGFKQTLFTIESHDSTAFKLTGGHLAVSCKSCHFKNEEWHFKSIGSQCMDCHKNIHGNEISEIFMQNNNCLSCHSTESWTKISFDHNKTKFELDGKHKIINCRPCHFKDNDGGIKEFRFASLKSNCETCHKDIHFGQFQGEGVSNCQHCHNFDNWAPSKFDHDKTNFSLTGAHLKLDCSRCHKTIEENGNIFIKYKLESFKCASCHS